MSTCFLLVITIFSSFNKKCGTNLCKKTKPLGGAAERLDMKYNIDCVRKVLLSLEDNLKLVKDEDGDFEYNEVRLQQLFSLLTPKYTEEDIVYTLEILNEAEYIDAYFGMGDGKIKTECVFVTSITYKGHEFLENIRDNKNWEKLKKVGKGIGSCAISVLGEIAKNYLISVAGNMFL